MNKRWFFFALGLALLYFANGRYSTAAAAWLFAPVLLHVSRNPATRHTGLLFPLAVGVVMQLAFWKFTSTDPTMLFFYVPFLGGLAYGGLFCADRWFVRRNTTFGATLFFPLLYTSLDFLDGLLNPFGTTGVLGYSQFGCLPVAQLASLTGIWGVTFVITWFGSVVQWAWGRPLAQTRHGLLTYGAVLVAVVTYGVVRLSMPLPGQTVRVAGVHRLDRELSATTFQRALAQHDTAAFLRYGAAQLRQLTEATVAQAKRGANVVVWAEASPYTLKSQEVAVLKQVQTLARQRHIYVVASPYLATTDGTKPENKAWLVSPAGILLGSHYKYGGNFLEGTVEGNRQLATIPTPLGRLATLVCWDADFPNTVRQLGRQQTGLVLHPAWNWREIDPLHTQVAVFRAIENGCSWVCQAQDGLSIMVDPRGKTLARMDHFETRNWVNVGNVPTYHLPTLYPIIGDLFGWLALAGLVVLLTTRRGNRPRKQQLADPARTVLAS